MKLVKILCIVISLVAILSVFCACRGEIDTTEPATGNTQVQTIATTQAEEGTQRVSEQNDTQEENIVTEDNELEIMTVPSDDGNEDKAENPTDATTPASDTEPETENKQEETRIELPFVPAV